MFKTGIVYHFAEHRVVEHRARVGWRAGNQEMVGASGFEPPTPCTPCRCATGLRHAPTFRSTPLPEVGSAPTIGQNSTPPSTAAMNEDRAAPVYVPRASA